MASGCDRSVPCGLAAQGKAAPLLTEWRTYRFTSLLGESMQGLRVEDASNASDFVAFFQKHRATPRRVHLVAKGSAGKVALHAAAIQLDLLDD